MTRMPPSHAAPDPSPDHYSGPMSMKGSIPAQKGHSIAPGKPRTIWKVLPSSRDIIFDLPMGHLLSAGPEPTNLLLDMLEPIDHQMQHVGLGRIERIRAERPGTFGMRAATDCGGRVPE